MMWYFLQSWDVMLHLFPKIILIVLLVNFLLAFGLNLARKQGLTNEKAVLIYSPITFSFLIVLWGFLFKANNTDGFTTYQWPQYIAVGIYLLQIIWTGYITYKLKGFRWYSISFGILVALYSAGAIFVAGMSITGDWF